MLIGMKATAAEWTERVSAWRASGLSADEFAKDKDFSAHLLRWWATEFVRRSRPRPPKPKPKPTVAMARVVQRNDARAETLAVHVGVARIAIGPGFDAALLRRVVSALGEGR